MSLNLIAGPTLDPVSLAEAKAHCRVTTDEENALIVGYILAARDHVETITNRTLITQTWELKIDEHWPIYFDRGRNFNRKLIQLPKSPVQSVSSIQYVDVNGTTQTLDPTQYNVYGLHDPAGGSGAIPGVAKIEPAFGIVWPMIRLQGNAITVRFVAGYGSEPSSINESIRQAMLMLISHWYDNRSPALEKARGLQVPYAVESLLTPHRIWFGDDTHSATYLHQGAWN